MLNNILVIPTIEIQHRKHKKASNTNTTKNIGETHVLAKGKQFSQDTCRVTQFSQDTCRVTQFSQDTCRVAQFSQDTWHVTQFSQDTCHVTHSQVGW